MWRGITLLIASAGLTSCSSSHESDQATSEASAGSSANVSSSAAAEASKPPAVTAPVAWERAYNASLEPEKEPEEPPPVVAEVKKPYPDCANYTARRMLEEKFADEIAKAGFAKQKDDAALQNRATELEVGAKANKRDLDGAVARGFFLTTQDKARKLKSYPAPAGAVESAAHDAPCKHVARVQAELADIDVTTDGFLCDVMGVHHAGELPSPRTTAAKAATDHKGQTWVDWVVCEVPGTPLRALVPIPEYTWQVAVKKDGDKLTLHEYKATDIASAELRKILRDDAQGLVDKRLRIHGITHVERQEHGPPAYKRLSALGFPTKLGVRAAEYKNLWVTSFETQCEADGLGCDVRDGQPPMKVAIVAVEPVEDVAVELPPEPGTADDAPEKPSSAGAWEEAAQAATDLSDKKSGSFDRYFDPSPQADVALLSTLGKPGTTSTTTSASPLDPPNAGPWRDELEKRGGLKEWECVVREMGEEVRPPTSPETAAALDALGEKTDEAHYWNIVCQGDKASYAGSIFVFIPTYDAYPVAKLEGSTATIEKYVATRHGLFPDAMRGKLHRVGIGSKLLFKSTGWLERRPYASTLFGRSWGEPRWATHFGKYACRHEGLGCERLKAPIVEVVDLKECDIEGYSYP